MQETVWVLPPLLDEKKEEEKAKTHILEVQSTFFSTRIVHSKCCRNEGLGGPIVGTS